MKIKYLSSETGSQKINFSYGKAIGLPLYLVENTHKNVYVHLDISRISLSLRKVILNEFPPRLFFQRGN